MLIKINQIIQNKQIVDEEHVDDFIDRIEQGFKIKPILVRNPEEGVYVLVDGRHRLKAFKILGRKMIEAEITL